MYSPRALWKDKTNDGSPRKTDRYSSHSVLPHVINRCVRRAYLCGKDPYSGKNYEHRRQWIVDKIKALSNVFAINICSYAVLSNHYHLVLHIDEAQAQSWETNTVIERWYELFKGNLLVDKYRHGETLCPAEQTTVTDCVGIRRV